MAEIKVEISGNVLRASVGATVLIIEKVGEIVEINANHIDELVLRDGTAYIGDETKVETVHVHGNSVVKGVSDAN